ncbi:YceI family protein [Flavobacterium sp. xlx-214]|uniref:YceI family protein n=1 Tax=unclassified Flavobacterium TaxID=196869 RepID=UPI0013D200C8|nr:MULTISPECIES: YceI family protein [unclassified Flavobacterium]MBA5793621.1 YceI family protein [Flavobacterium sp. xlx-221]QMI84550.1 YceI family protein [Flavobacterium sp. xlx-214]
MKKLSVLAFALATVLVSCNKTGDKANTTTEQQVAEQKGQVFTVDATTSTVKWTGYHKGGLNPRFGVIKADGTVAVENGAVTGGKFNLDLKSLVTDQSSVDPATSGGKTSADLDTHLKSADFFDVEKYPASTFEVTSVAAFDAAKDKSVIEGATNVISGNLTIKDKTVNVTFPAKVAVTEGNVTIESKFTINRQDWGLTYGTEGDAKDWMISQEIDVELNIQAKK